MSGRFFQSVAMQMKDGTPRTVGLIDRSGAVLACTDLSFVREKRADAAQFVQPGVFSKVGGYTYKPLEFWDGEADLAAFAKGEDELAAAVCGMAAITFHSVKQFYAETHDKTALIKNILLDNIVADEITFGSREMRIDPNVLRAVILIRYSGRGDSMPYRVVCGMFPESGRDFAVNVSDREIAVVREITAGTDKEEVIGAAESICFTLNSEAGVRAVAGIGSTVAGLKDLSVSFKEARTAIEVGQVFESDKHVVHYENLGIGRLIYQLPVTMCEMFLNEVFSKNASEALDAETLLTIQKFFENNLNVSEAARRLFVHRNTLVYRLEKIKKVTGLDLREFEQAIVFKVALMVRRYLISQGARL